MGSLNRLAVAHHPHPREQLLNINDESVFDGFQRSNLNSNEFRKGEPKQVVNNQAHVLRGFKLYKLPIIFPCRRQDARMF